MLSNHEMDGGIKIYLREIGKTDLLTPDQEVELAERIKRGDPDAREHMIRANLRLVVKIAQDYQNYGLPLLDLISEGNVGLMKAVERFDPNKGGKLSTYGAWWIKQSIKRALANQSKTIRLPVHMVDKISKMRRVVHAMTEELGREPTDDELSEEIGIDRGKLVQLKVASMRPASLDAPISEDDSTEFGEIVGDENAQSAFDLLSHKDMTGQLDGLLTVLDERERKIIDARFGLNGQKPRTLEEVGTEYGVTRERIRQLQNIALRKLRRALQKKEAPIPKVLKNEGKRKEKQFRKKEKKSNGMPFGSELSVQEVPHTIGDSAQYELVRQILRDDFQSRKTDIKRILGLHDLIDIQRELRICMLPVKIVGAGYTGYSPVGHWYLLLQKMAKYKFPGCYSGKRWNILSAHLQILLQDLFDGIEAIKLSLPSSLPGRIEKLEVIQLPIGPISSTAEYRPYKSALDNHIGASHESRDALQELLTKDSKDVLQELREIYVPGAMFFGKKWTPAEVNCYTILEPMVQWRFSEEKQPIQAKHFLMLVAEALGLQCTPQSGTDNSNGSSPPKYFQYSYATPECSFMSQSWNSKLKEEKHNIGMIRRTVRRDFSLGQIMQILIQTACVTPKEAVIILIHGDKKKGVNENYPPAEVAQMLGVPVAEVQKLLQ